MLKLRGISYLVGETHPDDLRRDLEIISRDLRCDTVMLISGDVPRLVTAAGRALDLGLDVYLRPDPTELPRTTMLERLDAAAVAAELLRREYPDRVTLVVGSEFSHTAPGIVPGPRSFLRLQLIIRFRRLMRHRIDRRLHTLLADAVTVARSRFNGPITYSAAAWEHVDWTLFDVVGVSLYRSRRNAATYADRVHDLVRRHDRPVVITEFGCGAFTGAEQRGAGSFQIVNWFTDPPRISGDHPRDESVQARYLTDLIDLYGSQGVHGCFVFTFAMPDFLHVDDPHLDLDKAGFGVMAARSDGTYQRKQAFHAVADAYRGIAEADRGGPRR
ncbi:MULTISPECIES: glycoside hydrolase family 113 [Polymorphospora]|uniref:Abortive infection protein n=1 Tax=Polymorphospora lycopeni TaxID=3140240 RepID=A0ABV5CP85_9ACTN